MLRYGTLERKSHLKSRIWSWLQTFKTKQIIESESNQFWIVWIVGFFGFLGLSAPKVEICEFGGSDAVMRAHAVQYGELPLPKGTGPMTGLWADTGPIGRPGLSIP